MITVNKLTKKFTIHEKEPGLLGSIRSLFFRQWQEKYALREVSLSIQPGEIVGLVGANGAGKTTLVKHLSGIIYPTSGEASVLGYTPWERHNEFRRQIALIMGQKAQLWWDLPAADCFLLLREIYQIPPQEFERNLSFLSQVLDVKKVLKTQIRRLSLGERMKMELIAALLHNPKVVFLDEPTIGLDLTAQRTIREFLLKYREEHQPAMILTSHYMEDIKFLCERIIILREGQIVYDGPLKELSGHWNNYKVITIHQEKDNPALEFPEKLGKIILRTNEKIRFQVKRDEIPAAASYILEKWQISDLSIEEEEIGVIIEEICQNRDLMKE